MARPCHPQWTVRFGTLVIRVLGSSRAPGVDEISPGTTPASLLAPFIISCIGIGHAVAPVTSAVMATARKERVCNVSASSRRWVRLTV